MMMQGMFEPIDLDVISQYQLQPVVHNHEQLEILSKARLETPLHVHLKINSGMNRLGFLPEQTRDAYNRLAAMPAVGAISLITHFANADSRDVSPDVATQVATFKKHTADIQADISLSNSPAILMHPEVRGDWIRPGVMLYGGSPGGGDAASFGLKAAMTLSSRVIAVQSIRAGDSVGYGSLFRAERDMRIGIVACGYADGYPRHAPSGTPMLVSGVRCATVGRVSMDMLCVDLTPVPQATLGSEVSLWGKASTGEVLSIDEVAFAAGTVSYELMCALASRVPVSQEN
jgi:alanine racemase